MSIAKTVVVAIALAAVAAIIGVQTTDVQMQAAAAQAQAPAAPPRAFKFHLEEATIADVHQAIRTRQITCRGLIQLYVNRARAYNGASQRLVTRDGAPIQPVPGVVRAGGPVTY